jgi:NADH:ubiquinone oxidoreductase subunit 5 (subunit L)/multisubunit Na+/H+ antiporter MnhA subunit
LLAVVTYIIITFVVSTVLYIGAMAGHTLPSDKREAITHWAANTYPFQGLVKTFMFYVTPDRLRAVADWTDNSAIAPIVTNLPQGNTSLDNIVNQTATQVNVT